MDAAGNWNPSIDRKDHKKRDAGMVEVVQKLPKNRRYLTVLVKLVTEQVKNQSGQDSGKNLVDQK